MNKQLIQFRRRCFALSHVHSNVQWTLFSAFNMSSSEEQWAGIGQHSGTQSRFSSAHLVKGNDWILTLEYMFLIVVESWIPPEEIHKDGGRTCQLHRDWLSPRGNWTQGFLVRRHRATIHFYDSSRTLSILAPVLQWLCCFPDWQSGFKWTFKEDCQTPVLQGCSTTFGLNGKHALWRKSIRLQ